MKIVVLDAATLDFNEAAWGGLKALSALDLYASTENDPELIQSRIADAAGVFTNKVLLSAETIQRAPSLKFIGVLATGYNAIDMNAAKAAGITVSNVPTYGTATTAQHTVALILELCNQVGLHNTSVQAGDWQRCPDFSYWKQAPIELDGIKVGVIGFGRIGQRVASILHAMGAEILVGSRSPVDTSNRSGYTWMETESIFKEADIVSLHCPESPSTKGMVNSTLLKQMKPGAFLVNTARGGLIVEADLRDALVAGTLAGAALDVLSSEPMSEDCPLLGLQNCVITPHIAWASEAARRRLLETSILNLKQFIAGQPQNVVSV